MRGWRGRFCRDRNGGVAVLFALAIVPLVGVVGAAMDYSRARNVEMSLQKVADSAALAAAQGTEPFATRRERGLSYLDGQLRRLGIAYEPAIEPVMEDGREVAVTVSLTAEVPTRIVRVLGIGSVDVAVAATATTGRDEVIDLAFVLDTTHSMTQNSGGRQRIDVLKATTTALIDDLIARRTETDQVRVSVVPFARYVNVGLGNRNQPWLDVPADHQTPRTRSCRMEQEVVGRQCERVWLAAEPARPRTCYRDGVPYACGSSAKPARWGQRCTNILGERMVEQCRTQGGNWVRWNGCVGSRNAPNDTRDENYGVRVPGLMSVTCGSPILEPTSNLASAKAYIRSLDTGDFTYIPAGLMWGWRALSPQAPILGRQDEDGVTVRRYMILVSDGFNTLSPRYPRHDGTRSDEANAILRTACENMARDEVSDITLFTIAFEVEDATVKSLLEDCSALNGGAFYDAADADGLADAMRQIGAQIGSLRLTQ